MPLKFLDFPAPAYLRFFYENLGDIGQLIFSSHGIWSPAKHGMTPLRYTYYWYVQPSVALTGAEYARRVVEMGAASPVDITGPGSGSVANIALYPLEQAIFTHTVRHFRDAYATENPKNMALMAFHGNKDVPGMTLSMLDSQLLPHFRYPLERPVHMVVCRSYNLNHVTTTVKPNVQVMAALPSISASITNDML
jgi:hypothetical protein